MVTGHGVPVGAAHADGQAFDEHATLGRVRLGQSSASRAESGTEGVTISPRMVEDPSGVVDRTPRTGYERRP